jgi:hypothetical protein
MSSFPNVIYGGYGDEKTTSSTKIGNLPLGTLMVLPDGRKFRHARVSATAGIAGNVYQGNVGIQGSDGAYIKSVATVSGVTAGSLTPVVTAGATTGATVNQFADGWFAVAGSAGAGTGLVYKIKGNGSAAAGSSITINLYETDPIVTALAAATTTVGLRENEYSSLTITTADTVGVGQVAGILPVPVSASYYCWVQRSGPALALTSGTLIVGVPCCVSDGIAGALEPLATAGADTAGTRIVKTTVPVATVLNVAASTGYSLVNLELE